MKHATTISHGLVRNAFIEVHKGLKYFLKVLCYFTYSYLRCIFSLNNVIVRLTKIMNRAEKNWAHFLENKVVCTLKIKVFKTFHYYKFFTEFFLERFDQFLMLKNEIENQNFEFFAKVVHDFGKPVDDII